MKTVVLINCGGCINLLELLQPGNDEDEDDQSGAGGTRGHHGSVTFFVVDSRRPLELDNVYNQDQVHLLLREGEELELPDFDDIYASDMVSRESCIIDDHSVSNITGRLCSNCYKFRVSYITGVESANSCVRMGVI